MSDWVDDIETKLNSSGTQIANRVSYRHVQRLIAEVRRLRVQLVHQSRSVSRADIEETRARVTKHDFEEKKDNAGTE
jgi:hypothetical protein